MHDKHYVRFGIGDFEGCQPGSLCDRCVDEVYAVWERGAQQLGRTTGRDVTQGSSIGKFLEVVIYTWNAAGLLCNDVSKMKAKFNYVERFCKYATVIALQETHDDGDTRCRDFIQMHSHSSGIFQSALYSAAGSVLIAIRKSYLDLFEDKKEYTLIPGRLLAVILKHVAMNVIFICIHLHANSNNNENKIELLTALRDFL